MATTTSECTVTCIFCKEKYIQTTRYDDGVDWLGHARGKSFTTKSPKKCPHCENDIKKAYEIVIKKEAHRNKVIESLRDYSIIKIDFKTNNTKYSYRLKNNNFKVGDFCIISNNNKKSLVEIFEIKSLDNLSNEEIDNLNVDNLKIFNGKKIDIKAIENKILEEISREKDYGKLSDLYKIIDIINKDLDDFLYNVNTNEKCYKFKDEYKNIILSL